MVETPWSILLKNIASLQKKYDSKKISWEEFTSKYIEYTNIYEHNEPSSLFHYKKNMGIK